VKTLIVRSYGIGNHILSTPMFRALKSLDHELVVVSEYVGIDAIIGHPALGAVIKWYPGYDDHENQVVEWLKRWRPDIAIAGAPVHGNAPDKFLNTAPRIMNVGKIDQWTKHEAQINLDYARELGWIGSWEPSEFYIPDEVDTQIEEQALREFGNPPNMYGFHFGCINHHNWIYKRWHLERYIELMDRLHRETGCHILLVGGGQERDIADQVVFSLDEDVREYVVDMVNRVPVKHAGSMIKHCKVFVSNDSGPLHIAVAVGIPVVGIFGMSDEVKNGPWTDPSNPSLSRVITEDLWCRPCYGTNRHGMCERGDCLDLITVDRVFNAVMELTEANSA
jgi:ADP-heptose:LPS heptosyltransferase